ncbi:enoyl-CoA hydratase/isomerase family protein [Hydrogenophaga palleronii]|uniref:enoyl-CoA hydratase/isomerase family protein n=1 Tax=Hydrogenophaga palleronii TaxID=65655 RepID=UPI000825BF1F|nr:enoyl-CoA hydratase/isomerase family protein [Hydrogenophaga palleronii]
MSNILYKVHKGIAEITLDNAPVNALTTAMVTELIAALHRAAKDDSAKVIVISSAVARRFCAGLDLAALQDAAPEQIRALLEQLYTGLSEAQFALGKPSIAAVAGAARGGGMTLAISCDMLVAGKSASFGYPEIDVGVLPAIHFTHLPRIVGRHRAFELLFTGRTFGSDEAFALGLVNSVVDDSQVMDSARELAATLVAKPQYSLAMGRRAFMNATDNGWRQGVAGAVETFCNVAVSAEGREGVAAYAEKRTPSWVSKK